MLVVLLSSSSAFAQNDDADRRAAIPEAAAQMKTLAEVKQIFNDEYTKAKKPEDKGVLARNLLKQAEEQKEDVVARYVLFKEALRLAQEGFDPETSLASVDSLAKEYQIDDFAMRHDLLDDFSKKAKTPQVLRTLNEANKASLEKAVAADKFAIAVKFCLIGDRLSLVSKNTAERKQYLDAKTTIVAQQKEFEAAETAKEILATKPDDPTANFDRGVYLLSRKGDWQAGLEHLSKSGDSELRSLAKLDLSNPEDTKKRLELAEGWFEWTTPMKKTKPVWSKALAKYWYSQIAAQVTGLDRTKVEKRLKDIGELDLKRDISGVAVAKSVIKPIEPMPMPRAPMNVPRQPMPNAVLNVPRNNPAPAAPAVVIRPLGKLPPVGELPPKVEAKNPYASSPVPLLEPEQLKLSRELFLWGQKTPGLQLAYRFSAPNASGSGSVSMGNRDQEPNGPFLFSMINSLALPDDQFKAFKGLKTIDHVLIQAPGSTGAWIKHLEAATFLQRIDINVDRAVFADEYAAELTKFPNLMHFNSARSAVGPKVIRALAACPAMTTVGIRPGPTVTPLDVAALRKTHINEVSLNYAHEAYLLALQGAPELKSMNLSNMTISDAAIAQMHEFDLDQLTLTFNFGFTGAGFGAWKTSKLQSLVMSNSQNIDEAGMAAVLGLPELTTLKIARQSAPLSLTRVKSSATLSKLELEEVKSVEWNGLENLTSLKNLAFRGLEVPVTAFKHLKKLPIENASFDYSNVGDAHVKELVGHPTLRYVMLIKTQVTDEAVSALKAANPRLGVHFVK